jgi:hypothetical protein
LHATPTLRRGLTPRITRFFQPTLASLARTLAFAGALAVGLTAQRGHAATIIFDNLNAPLPNGALFISNTNLVAQAFTTTGTDFVLNAVHLKLYNQNGTTGGYELQLRDTTGASGGPGAQVGAALYTGLAQGLSGTPGSLLSVTGLNRVLAPNTTYYLVAAGTTLTDVPDPYDSNEPPQPGYLAWNMTSTLSTGARSSGAWGNAYSYSGYMKIEAGPGGASVPDVGHTPTALGAILAGLATLRRRLQR